MVRGGGSGVRGLAPEMPEPFERTHEGGGQDTAEDLFGLDLAFRERVVPVFRFLFERYWRIETFGLHHVQSSGPILFVANHSGALPFDGAMICTALHVHDGRIARFLFDRFVANVAPVDAFYRRVGGAVATRENASEIGRAHV